MKLLLLSLISIICTTGVSDKVRSIEYNGQSVKTTYDVPEDFYGTYAGPKQGYLTLQEDGSGTYNYDVFGFAISDCEKEAITIEWGFLLDEKNEIVNFKREYGLSYPILMKSTSSTSFQGCRKSVMLDFIMAYKNGKIGVSSSDNWTKDTE